MNELVKVNASDYGLEETKAAEISAMFIPMLDKMNELEGEYNNILKQEINPETCQMAKDLRMCYVKTRTGTEKIHKDLKAFYLNGGRFVDAWKNTQLQAAGEKEKTLKAIEDHFENMEKERIEKIRIERESLLKPYTDAFPLALGHMEQTVFDNTLLGFKTAYEMRIAAEKKAEEERIEAAKKEAERLEAQRLENLRLKAEAEEREKQMEVERKKAKAIQDKKDAELKKERELAAQKQAELEAKAKAEAEEREKLQAQLRAKEQAEAKAKQDAEAKISAEKKAKEQAEKKAKLTPDKDKLLTFMQSINDLPRPQIKAIEAASIMTNVEGLLAKINQYVLDNINKI